MECSAESGRARLISALLIRKVLRADGRGAAPLLMRAFIEKARAEGRRGLILTCKERLIHYYEQFGFVNMGVSASEHGGAVWYDMTLEF